MALVQRNTSFSILKAIAIIFVVMGHSGEPAWMGRFMYMMHVPIFFICAGYFFKDAYIESERKYLVGKVKGLYFPFLKWSLLFLLLHNVFFAVGIFNEQVGNESGGVMHPYTWHAFGQRFFSIVFNMSGYDEFLAGAFWFFRALLISSVLFLVGFKALGRFTYFKDNVQKAWAIGLTALLLAMWLTLDGLTIAGISQGGYREMMGLFFISMGYIFQKREAQIPTDWWVLVACAVFLVLATAFFHSAMVYRTDFWGFIKLPLPALAGFFLFLQLSKFINRRETIVKRILVFIGDNTLYVFAFHFLAFKLVSVLKIMIEGLPWNQLGAHPVIKPVGNFDAYFILYTIVGVALPLLGITAYRRWCTKIHIDVNAVATIGFASIVVVLRLIVRGFRWLVRMVRAFCLGVVDMVKGIIDASRTDEE